MQYFTIKKYNESFELARDIKADKYIEKFLKDFRKPFEDNLFYNQLFCYLYLPYYQYYQ